MDAIVRHPAHASEVSLFALYNVTWVSVELRILRKHLTGVSGCSVFLREKP